MGSKVAAEGTGLPAQDGEQGMPPMAIVGMHGDVAILEPDTIRGCSA